MSTEEVVAMFALLALVSSVGTALVGAVAKYWISRIRNQEYDSARIVALDELLRHVARQTDALQRIASTLDAIAEIEAARNNNWPEEDL